jgi:RNA polymerase sigma-70 factor (ECF subfamily)
MDVDERLAVEAAQKDRAKFGELYERHVDGVYAYVVRRVRDRSAAEDITADVFHKALAGLQTFEWRGAPFGAWLLRIAANAISDRARRFGREVPDVLQGAEPSVPPDVDLLDRRADLSRFVDELPVDQRRVVVERFIEQRSVREIAGRLNKTEGAVKQLQFRALQSLRAKMEAADA